MNLAPELAGQVVRCPHCQQPLQTPPINAPLVHGQAGLESPSPSPQIPGSAWGEPPKSDVGTPEVVRRSAPVREAADSIFGEPDELDDSLFGPTPKSRQSVVPLDPQQATDRIPGLADLPPIRPFNLPEPTPPPVDHSNGVPFPEIDESQIEILSHTLANPFELPDEAIEPEPVKKVKKKAKAVAKEVAKEEPEEPKAKSTTDWKLIILVGVSVYAALVTILAIWGWMRTATVTPDHQPAKTARTR